MAFPTKLWNSRDLAQVPVPVDKGLPGSTSKVEYPSLQAAWKHGLDLDSLERDTSQWQAASKQLPTNSQGQAQANSSIMLAEIQVL